MACCAHQQNYLLKVGPSALFIRRKEFVINITSLYIRPYIQKRIKKIT